MIALQSSRHLPAVLALVPGIGMLVFVLCYGVDVPFFDQWLIVPALSDWIAGDGSFEQLWEPHNKHRITFGRILMFGLAWLTDWNIRAELVLNAMIAK